MRCQRLFTFLCCVSFLRTALLDAANVTGAPRMTISGQSAGGSMAIQHLVAFSSQIDGATIAAGSPYACGRLPKRGKRCYYGNVDIHSSLEILYELASKGQIDSLENLKEIPVVLFNGNNDWTVYTRTMRDVYTQLSYFVNPGYLYRRFNTNAAHVWSLDHGGCSCGKCGWYSASPLCCDVNNCDYDLSGDMLQKFYGDIKPKRKPKQSLHWIDQQQYTPNGPNEKWSHSGLWRYGFAYVPTNCEDNPRTCRLHVNYHGCIRMTWKRRRLWSSSIELNSYAEANDIIVFYPQAAGTTASGKGCWNWAFTEDDPSFDTKASVQLRTVISIVKDLHNAVSNAIKVNNSIAFYSQDAEPEIADDLSSLVV